VIADFI